MYSIRTSVLLFLIFAAKHFSPTAGEIEERKHFKTIFDLLIGIGNGFYYESNGVSSSSRLDCPLCDSSVYSYCSEKLLHDACCCLNPYVTPYFTVEIMGADLRSSEYLELCNPCGRIGKVIFLASSQGLCSNNTNFLASANMLTAVFYMQIHVGNTN